MLGSSFPSTLAAEKSEWRPRWTGKRSVCTQDLRFPSAEQRLRPPVPPQVPHYSLTVQAADEGRPPLSSAVLVTISVADVNDNPPVFSRVNHSLLLQVRAASHPTPNRFRAWSRPPSPGSPVFTGANNWQQLLENRNDWRLPGDPGLRSLLGRSRRRNRSSHDNPGRKRGQETSPEY